MNHLEVDQVWSHTAEMLCDRGGVRRIVNETTVIWSLTSGWRAKLKARSCSSAIFLLLCVHDRHVESESELANLLAWTVQRSRLRT